MNERQGSRGKGACVGAVIHSHSVQGCDGPDEMSSSRSSRDGCLLVPVGQSLATEERGSTLGDLEDDGTVDVPCGLKTGIDDRRRRHVLGEVSSLQGPEKASLRWPIKSESHGQWMTTLCHCRTYGDRKLIVVSTIHVKASNELTLFSRAYSKSLRTLSPVMTPAWSNTSSAPAAQSQCESASSRGRWREHPCLSLPLWDTV